MKKLIFINAWEMFKSNLFKSFGEALKAAWSKFKLFKLLKLGKVAFSYFNVKGEKRAAIGTLNPSLFNYAYKGTAKKKAANVLAYFDLEKQAFRSLCIERLIAVA